MSEDETVERKPGKLRLQPKGTLGLKKTVDAGQVQQNCKPYAAKCWPRAA